MKAVILFGLTIMSLSVNSFASVSSSACHFAIVGAIDAARTEMAAGEMLARSQKNEKAYPQFIKDAEDRLAYSKDQASTLRRIALEICDDNK